MTHAQEDLTSFLKSKIPKDLTLIIPGKTKESELAKYLKAKPLKKESVYFYHLSHMDYDTSIGVKEGLVDYVLFHFKKESLTQSQLSTWISKDELTKNLTKEIEYDHEYGREIEISKEKGKLKIVFLNNSNYTVDSVSFFGDE